MPRGDNLAFGAASIFPSEHGDEYVDYRAGYDPNGRYWTIYVGSNNSMNDWMHAWNAVNVLSHVDLKEEQVSLGGRIVYYANEHANGH